jgi:5-methylcytosine-specific restriction endonuclease McrA
MNPKRDLEFSLADARRMFRIYPNSGYKSLIKTYEDYLIKNYPDSELLEKKKEPEPVKVIEKEKEPKQKKEKEPEPVKVIKKEKKPKKKAISATVKRLVWNTNIGEDIGKAKCLCCKSTDIIQMSFHCGHIIAEANGGEIIVSNLKPICQNCNSSMGTKNMNEFMKSLK